MNTLVTLLLSGMMLISEPLAAINPGVKIQIKGNIGDAESGKTIPYATVTVQNTKKIIKRVACDSDGKFEFTIDSIGKYMVLVQSLNYKPSKKEVILDAKSVKVDIGTIKLTPSTEKLGEVTVGAQKPLVRTEIDKIVYNIEADPESKTANALEMLRKVPMVTVDGEDNIQVKGSSSFKIMLNGKTSSMLTQNPKDVLKSLPANMIKDIELITDPSSKYEAEGTGGIINIITVKKQLNGFMGRVNSGFDSRGGYNEGLYASSKVKKFGFSVNYSYNNFRQPQNESTLNRENLLSTTSRYTDSDGHSGYKGSSNSSMGEASY